MNYLPSSKALFYLKLSIIVFIVISCKTVLKSGIKDDGKQIPPDFGKNNTTLLAISHNIESYDRYLKKNLKENYSGEYIIINRNEVSDYEDIEKYRYIFDYERIINDAYASASGPSKVSSTYFFLLDRKTNLKYRSNVSSDFFSKLMIAYLQRLEEVRKAN